MNPAATAAASRAADTTAEMFPCLLVSIHLAPVSRGQESPPSQQGKSIHLPVAAKCAIGFVAQGSPMGSVCCANGESGLWKKGKGLQKTRKEQICVSKVT